MTLTLFEYLFFLCIICIMAWTLPCCIAYNRYYTKDIDYRKFVDDIIEEQKKRHKEGLTDS